MIKSMILFLKSLYTNRKEYFVEYNWFEQEIRHLIEYLTTPFISQRHNYSFFEKINLKFKKIDRKFLQIFENLRIYCN